MNYLASKTTPKNYAKKVFIIHTGAMKMRSLLISFFSINIVDRVIWVVVSSGIRKKMLVWSKRKLFRPYIPLG